MKFNLKCTACNTKDIRNAEECKGDSPPLCQKCSGLMMAESVENK